MEPPPCLPGGRVDSGAAGCSVVCVRTCMCGEYVYVCGVHARPCGVCTYTCVVCVHVLWCVHMYVVHVCTHVCGVCTHACGVYMHMCVHVCVRVCGMCVCGVQASTAAPRPACLLLRTLTLHVL